jgi:hypothetical protein
MITKTLSACAVIAAAIVTPAHAADDPRALGGTHLQIRSAGIGAQASVRLKFGSDKVARSSERLEFGFAAGPVMRRRIGNGATTSHIASTASFRLRPGYSATFAVGGQPIVRHYTRLGAAEAKKDGGGPSTLGWIAIGTGVALGIAYLALEDALDCTENGDYICE